MPGQRGKSEKLVRGVGVLWGHLCGFGKRSPTPISPFDRIPGSKKSPDGSLPRTVPSLPGRPGVVPDHLKKNVGNGGVGSPLAGKVHVSKDPCLCRGPSCLCLSRDHGAPRPLHARVLSLTEGKLSVSCFIPCSLSSWLGADIRDGEGGGRRHSDEKTWPVSGPDGGSASPCPWPAAMHTRSEASGKKRILSSQFSIENVGSL